MALSVRLCKSEKAGGDQTNPWSLDIHHPAWSQVPVVFVRGFLERWVRICQIPKDGQGKAWILWRAGGGWGRGGGGGGGVETADQCFGVEMGMSKWPWVKTSGTILG